MHSVRIHLSFQQHGRTAFCAVFHRVFHKLNLCTHWEIFSLVLKPKVQQDGPRRSQVRTDSHEVPRVAGIGDWPNVRRGFNGPRLTNALYCMKDEHWPGAMFYVSSSRTMGRQGFHRDHTRFSCPEQGLRKNWHAHTMTEFWSPLPGPFRPDLLYELSSLLCRQAPTWDGTLDRPSPIHLAHAVVRDHPDRYEVQNYDDETLNLTI